MSQQMRVDSDTPITLLEYHLKVICVVIASICLRCKIPRRMVTK